MDGDVFQITLSRFLFPPYHTFICSLLHPLVLLSIFPRLMLVLGVFSNLPIHWALAVQRNFSLKICSPPNPAL